MEQYNQIMTMAKNIVRAIENREALRGVHIVCDECGNCRAEVCNGYTGGTYKFTVAAHAGGNMVKMEIRRGIDPVRITNGTHNMLVLPVRHPGNDW